MHNYFVATGALSEAPILLMILQEFRVAEIRAKCRLKQERNNLGYRLIDYYS